MVRFTAPARTPRRLGGPNSLHAGRKMLRRLLDENLSLMRELEDLRKLRQFRNLIEDDDMDLVRAPENSSPAASFNLPPPSLPTRRMFERRLVQELSWSSRRPGTCGSLLSVSVDEGRRAPVDASPGPGGAPVQISSGIVSWDVMAELVRGALRSADLCCRVGRRDMLVLLPGTDVRGARTVMARLRAAVMRAGARHEAPVGISIGCATWPVDSTLAGALVAQANSARGSEKRRQARVARRPLPAGPPRFTVVK